MYEAHLRTVGAKGTGGLWSTALHACAGCLLIAGAAPVFAQDASPVTASVEIASEVTLTKTRDMDFGRIIVPAAGRIDMTAEETPTCTPNNGITPLDACTSASFVGSAGTAFQIRISTPIGRRAILSGPGQDLRLRRLAVGAGDGLTFTGRTNRHFDFTVTDADGDFEFYVGGRMLFRNNQTPGLYSGTFTIEVDYQ